MPELPEHNLALVALKAAWNNPGPDDDDKPAYDMAADVDPDGVVRFRRATLSEVLDRMVARWIWESAELIGEVE